MIRSALIALLPLVCGSTVNFEDAQRLKRAHADCRLQSLQSWSNGRFDLGKLENEWRLLKNETNSAFMLNQLISGRSQQFSQDVQRITNIFQTLDQRRSFSETILQTSFFGTIERLVTSENILRHEQGQSRLQEMIQRVNEQERKLQQQLNTCRNQSQNFKSQDIFQTLTYARMEQKYNEMLSQKKHEEQIFAFSEFYSMWSEFWHEVRQSWSSMLYTTESQEWSAWWNMITTGQEFVSTSEEWHGFTEEFAQQELTWSVMSWEMRQKFLEERRIFSGLGYFGYLVVQAEMKGLDGHLGYVFGLTRPHQRPIMNVNVIHWLPKRQDRDFFLLMAETIAPHDFTSTMHNAMFGHSVLHHGEMYIYNAYSGHYEHSSGSVFEHFETLEIEEMSSVIDQLLCIYQVRNGESYFQDLRAWYMFGRERGMPEPSKVPVEQQCPKNYNEYHNVHWKREHLCTLRQANLITEAEYERISHMIFTYEETLHMDVEQMEDWTYYYQHPIERDLDLPVMPRYRKRYPRRIRYTRAPPKPTVRLPSPAPVIPAPVIPDPVITMPPQRIRMIPPKVALSPPILDVSLEDSIPEPPPPPPMEDIQPIPPPSMSPPSMPPLPPMTPMNDNPSPPPPPPPQPMQPLPMMGPLESPVMDVQLLPPSVRVSMPRGEFQGMAYPL